MCKIWMNISIWLKQITTENIISFLSVDVSFNQTACSSSKYKGVNTESLTLFSPMQWLNFCACIEIVGWSYCKIIMLDIFTNYNDV